MSVSNAESSPVPIAWTSLYSASTAGSISPEFFRSNVLFLSCDDPALAIACCSPNLSTHYILIQPRLNEMSRITPAANAAPMFHIAKAATMIIT